MWHAPRLPASESAGSLSQSPNPMFLSMFPHPTRLSELRTHPPMLNRPMSVPAEPKLRLPSAGEHSRWELTGADGGCSAPAHLAALLHSLKDDFNHSGGFPSARRPVDDSEFLLGQRKQNRFLLGGVQGGVVENQRLCGRRHVLGLAPCRARWEMKGVNRRELGLPRSHLTTQNQPALFSKDFSRIGLAGYGPQATPSRCPIPGGQSRHSLS